jgi:hypothetical protein
VSFRTGVRIGYNGGPGGGRTAAGASVERPRPRKVRAPQSRLAGNARPPRGEDQRHSDDARRFTGGSETRQALAGARPNRGAQGGLRAAAGGSLSSRVGRQDGWSSVTDGDIGSRQNSAYRPLSRDITAIHVSLPGRGARERVGQSSSSRHTDRAVQALQTGRASSIEPRGSGYSGPPSRQSTCTEGGSPARMLTWRTEQRRIRPDRAMGRRSVPPSTGFNAMIGVASDTWCSEQHGQTRIRGVRSTMTPSYHRGRGPGEPSRHGACAR